MIKRCYNKVICHREHRESR